MSRIVIDTQIVVWHLLDIARLTLPARQAIKDASRILVSAASLYEIEFKRRLETRRGLRTLLHDLPSDLPQRLTDLGLVLLDVTPAIAWRAARLELDHGDPWDRIILSHSLELDVPLISSDARLRQAMDAHVIW